MRKRILFLVVLISLAGAAYAPCARAESDEDVDQSDSSSELRSPDDSQDRVEDRRVPGQATRGTANDPNVYRCGATSACN